MDELLTELLAQAREHGLTVHVSIHGVPTAVALGWLQDGLLDRIEQGAGTNPPTGRLERSTPEGDDKPRRITVCAFTDGPHRHA